MVELPAKREAAEWIRGRWPQVSKRRAGKLVQIPRSTLRYRCLERGSEMRRMVRETALEYPRYGHRRITLELEKKLERGVSQRNVQRIMQKLCLQVRTRRRRKWAARPVVAADAVQRADERWAMDFVSEWCVGVKRPLRILAMVDCCTREALALRVGYSMPAKRVVETLENLRVQGRKPTEIRVDNGAGVHQQPSGDVVSDERSPGELHPTRQAQPEWLCGELQWEAPGRVFERALFPG